MKKIVQWLLDDITLDLYQQADFRKILSFFLYLILCGYLVISFLSILFGWWLNLWGVAAGFILSMLALFLYRRQATGAAIFLLLLTLFSTTAYSLFAGNGIYTASIGVFYIILALASLLLRFRGLLFLYLLSISILSLTALLSAGGYIHSPAPKDLKGDVLVINTILTVFTLIMRILGNSIRFFRKEHARQQVAIREKDQEIQISREKIHFLHLTLRDNYFEASTGGQLLQVSPRLLQLLDYNEKVLPAASALAVHSYQLRSLARGLARSRSLSNFEFTVQGRNGQTHVLQINAALVPYDHSRIVAGTAVDITDRIRFNEKISQLHKLDSLGKMASGLAHDFHNLITVINVNAELLLRRCLEMGLQELDTHIEPILDATTRAGILTRRIRDFSRHQTPQLRPVVVQPLVEQTLKISRTLVPPEIIITTDFPDTIQTILADPSQLEQILMNLLLNARDALLHPKLPSRKKEIQISLRQRDVFENLDLPSLHLKKGRYLEINVRDNGIGMNEGQLQQLFEPFFTTKGEQGAGLGLSSVYAILTQNCGDILVDSSPGQGTTFTLYWPLADQLR